MQPSDSVQAPQQNELVFVPNKTFNKILTLSLAGVLTTLALLAAFAHIPNMAGKIFTISTCLIFAGICIYVYMAVVRFKVVVRGTNLQMYTLTRTSSIELTTIAGCYTFYRYSRGGSVLILTLAQKQAGSKRPGLGIGYSPKDFREIIKSLKQQEMHFLNIPLRYIGPQLMPVIAPTLLANTKTLMSSRTREWLEEYATAGQPSTIEE